MTTAAILASCVLAISQPEPLPLVSVDLHSDRIEFLSADGVEIEREVFWFAWSPVDSADPVTIDDCVASAQIACGPAGIKRLYYRVNPTTGEVVCDFECNSTGTKG